VITHPEKVLFPEDGITKGEMAAYYEAVAPVIVPHLRGRPVTMERYPSGIGSAGFMQKDVSKGFPPWLARVEVPKKGGTVHHPLVHDTQSLLWLANQNCITPHVWTSRLPDLYQPDLVVFDLDPSEDEPEVLRAAALAVRDLLEELSLPSWLKTTGSKGYHIAVPLDGKAGFDEVSRFANGVAKVLVARDPDRLTLEFSKADRGGRILIDVGRNGYGATFAAPLCSATEAGRAGLCALHLGRAGTRRRYAPGLQAAHDGGSPGRDRRPLGRHVEAPALAASAHDATTTAPGCHRGVGPLMREAPRLAWRA
jgi:bifunctional non-homologous end joining protein LigD